MRPAVQRFFILIGSKIIQHNKRKVGFKFGSRVFKSVKDLKNQIGRKAGVCQNICYVVIDQLNACDSVTHA